MIDYFIRLLEIYNTMDSFGPAINFMGNMMGLAITYKAATDVMKSTSRSTGRMSKSRHVSIWNY